jgi:hypothetical protein
MRCAAGYGSIGTGVPSLKPFKDDVLRSGETLAVKLCTSPLIVERSETL